MGLQEPEAVYIMGARDYAVVRQKNIFFKKSAKKTESLLCQVLLCFVFLCSEIAVEFAVPKYLPAFAVFSRSLGQSKREAADTVAAYQAAMVASR